MGENNGGVGGGDSSNGKKIDCVDFNDIRSIEERNGNHYGWSSIKMGGQIVVYIWLYEFVAANETVKMATCMFTSSGNQVQKNVI